MLSTCRPKKRGNPALPPHSQVQVQPIPFAFACSWKPSTEWKSGSASVSCGKAARRQTARSRTTCDVGERTVAGWVAGDGISYKNAKKVAELFEVDIDWLWRGRERGATPDLMGQLDGGSVILNRVEQMCQEIGERLEALEAGQGAIVAEILAALEQMPSAPSTSEADRRRRGSR
jgi:hypothetical protein